MNTSSTVSPTHADSAAITAYCESMKAEPLFVYGSKEQPCSTADFRSNFTAKYPRPVPNGHRESDDKSWCSLFSRSVNAARKAETMVAPSARLGGAVSAARGPKVDVQVNGKAFTRAMANGISKLLAGLTTITLVDAMSKHGFTVAYDESNGYVFTAPVGATRDPEAEKAAKAAKVVASAKDKLGKLGLSKAALLALLESSDEPAVPAATESTPSATESAPKADGGHKKSAKKGAK